MHYRVHFVQDIEFLAKICCQKVFLKLAAEARKRWGPEQYGRRIRYCLRFFVRRGESLATSRLHMISPPAAVALSLSDEYRLPCAVWCNRGTLPQVQKCFRSAKLRVNRSAWHAKKLCRWVSNKREHPASSKPK